METSHKSKCSHILTAGLKSMLDVLLARQLQHRVRWSDAKVLTILVHSKPFLAQVVVEGALRRILLRETRAGRMCWRGWITLPDRSNRCDSSELQHQLT